MRAAWLVLACSCALLSKGEATVPRYFTAEPARGPVVEAAALPPVHVRLGRVSASRALGERIMYRTSGTEVGYHEDRLWTESPEAYLRRALARELFEVRGAVALSRAGSPTVDVELVEFLELTSPAPAGRVTVAVAYSDGEGSWVHRTLSSERPVSAAAGEQRPQAVARAISEALADVVRATADLVVEELRRQDAAAARPSR